MKTVKRTSFMLILAAVIAAAGILLPGTASVSAKSIKLNHTEAYMAKSDTLKLKITGTKKTAKWSSSNKKVAQVSAAGKVTAKKYGKAVITAKIGSKKLKCNITVEKKAVNNARKLVTYIEERGKYDEDDDLQKISLRTTDENTGDVTDVTIALYPGSTMLDFVYELSPDAPYSMFRVVLSIDLVSGKSSTKKGKLVHSYSYPDAYQYDTYNASVSTKYNGKDKGLKLKKFRYSDAAYDEDTGEEDIRYYTVKDASELAKKKSTVSKQLNNAFAAWDALFGGIKPLKKAGIRMQTIGFGNWK